MIITYVDVAYLYRKAGFRSALFMQLELNSIFGDRDTISSKEYCDIAKGFYDRGLLSIDDYIKAVKGGFIL